MSFHRSDDYPASPDPAVAVNAADALQRNLPVKGELARQVARAPALAMALAMALAIVEWQMTSATAVQQVRYDYDAIGRFGAARANHGQTCIRRGKLRLTFMARGGERRENHLYHNLWLTQDQTKV